MALEIHDASEVLLAPVTQDVRRVVSPGELADYRMVREQAWGQKGADHSAFVADLLHTSPDEMGVYVAYVDGTPASCARASFDTGSQFAGLWGGATAPAFRKLTWPATLRTHQGSC